MNVSLPGVRFGGASSIESLERGDNEDLSPLALLFARLERTAILQALSVDADAEISHQRSLTSAVLETLKDKFGKRREAKDAELRNVDEVALALRSRARHELQQTYDALGETISQLSEPDIRIFEGGPDRNNAHWYKYEVVKSANEGGKYANFSENHYFVKASIRAERERMVFVTSFHHVGRELSGFMEATAFAQLESYEDSDDRKSVSQDFFICSPEPFVFTYRTKEQDIADAFSRWLDMALAVAVKEYGDRL
jgi:hypothetical protein